MSIIIENISKTFVSGSERKEVLKGADLHVDTGEIFLLSGANGAGKTTLLKILSTLVLPTSGTASIAGYRINDHPEQVRRSIGLVFDAERSFYQMLTIEENLRFFGGLAGVPGRDLSLRIPELIEQLRLTPWRKTRMSYCSSGIRQKLAIARALLHRPAVLLIDELTRSLDKPSQEEISVYINDIAALNHTTCLIVTHAPIPMKSVKWNAGTLENGIIMPMISPEGKDVR
jgi:ABC-2 type transport system ATP-binding protein